MTSLPHEPDLHFISLIGPLIVTCILQIEEYYKVLKLNKRSETIEPAEKPLLVANKPDRDKVERIVKALDSSADGEMSASEIKVLFSKLLGIPEVEIPDDHSEVVLFAGLSLEGMVENLCRDVSRGMVEEYHAAMFPTPIAPPVEKATEDEAEEENVPEADALLFKPKPDKEKVCRIVAALDVSGDGVIQASEVKVLFSKLLRVPAEEIADDHSEVLQFAGLSMDEMTESLMMSVSKDTIDEYFRLMCPELPILAPAADRSKVELIVTLLDTSEDGILSIEEVKRLVSKMLGLPESSIADDEATVLEFAGMSTHEMIDRFCKAVPPAKVEEYYDAMFPPEDKDVMHITQELLSNPELLSNLKEANSDLKSRLDRIKNAHKIQVFSRGSFNKGVFEHESQEMHESRDPLGVWHEPTTGHEFEVVQEREIGEPLEGAFLQHDRTKMIEDIVHAIIGNLETTPNGVYDMEGILKRQFNMSDDEIPPEATDDHLRKVLGFAGLVQSLSLMVPKSRLYPAYEALFPGET